MISVKEAAAALGISPRSVQEKCNKFKVVKVNGQFQITQELLDLWLTKAERKTNEVAAQPKPRTELAENRAENRALPRWQIVVICAAVAALVVGLIVWKYTGDLEKETQRYTDLKESDDKLLKEVRAAAYKTEANLKVQLDSARSELKTIKDELKTIKSDPRVKRFLKN
jgi:hypothetical protein